MSAWGGSSWGYGGGGGGTPDLAAVLAEGNSAAGPILLGDGTAAAPSFAFSEAGGIGVYRDGTLLRLATAGASRVSVGTTTTVNTTLALAGNQITGALVPVSSPATGTSLGASGSNGVYTNTGATGTRSISPGANQNGTFMRFVRTASHALRVAPSGSQNFMLEDGSTTTNGKYLELASDGAALSIVLDGTTWVVLYSRGTITVEP